MANLKATGAKQTNFKWFAIKPSTCLSDDRTLPSTAQPSCQSSSCQRRCLRKEKTQLGVFLLRVHCWAKWVSESKHGNHCTVLLFHPCTLVHHGFKLANSYAVLRLFCLHGDRKADFQNFIYLYTIFIPRLSRSWSRPIKLMRSVFKGMWSVCTCIWNLLRYFQV